MIRRTNVPKRICKESKRSSMRKRSFKESSYRMYSIIPSANARNIEGSILDTLVYDCNFLYIPKSTDLALPWDADFVIEGSNIVFCGAILPGGPSYGSCEVMIPLNKINDLVEFEAVDIPYDVIDYLESNGWKVVG